MILVDQFDTLISSERERAFFRRRDVRFFKKMSLQNIVLIGIRKSYFENIKWLNQSNYTK